MSVGVLTTSAPAPPPLPQEPSAVLPQHFPCLSLRAHVTSPVSYYSGLRLSSTSILLFPKSD